MFKNIKSLFIREDETPQTATGAPAQAKAPTTAAPLPPPSPSQTPPVVSGNTALDQRMFDSLQKTLEDNNLPGFDFLEFRNSLKTLAGIIPDEATRYQSAYATAATMGVTADKLLESARFYQGLLEKERDNFNKAVNQQVDQNVTAKQKEVANLQVLIRQKSEEVARLTREIAAHQEEMATAAGVISEAEEKIENTKNTFQHTMNTVLNQIQTDSANIERYLKPHH